MKFIKIADTKGFIHFINTIHIIKLVVDKATTLIYVAGEKSYIIGTEKTPEEIIDLINS